MYDAVPKLGTKSKPPSPIALSASIPKFIPLEPSNQPAFTPIMTSLPYGTI